ncbi:uncharacterized [Tachysurus ichikawai]
MATQQSDPVNSLTRHRGVKVVSAVSMEECGGGGEKAYRTAAWVAANLGPPMFSTRMFVQDLPRKRPQLIRHWRDLQEFNPPETPNTETDPVPSDRVSKPADTEITMQAEPISPEITTEQETADILMNTQDSIK